MKYALPFSFEMNRQGKGKEEPRAELDRSLCVGGFAAVNLKRQILKTKMDFQAALIEQVVRLFVYDMLLIFICVILSPYLERKSSSVLCTNERQMTWLLVVD